MDLIWIYNSNNSCRENNLFCGNIFVRESLYFVMFLFYLYSFLGYTVKTSSCLKTSLNFIQSQLMSSEFMRTWYWIWPLHVIPYHLYISILAYVSWADVTHTLTLEVFVSQVMSLLEFQRYVCMYWQALISVWSLNSFIFMTNRQNKKKNGDRWRSFTVPPFQLALSLSLSLSLVSLCSLLIHLFLSALIRMMSSLHNHRDCRNDAPLTVEHGIDFTRLKAKHNWSNTHSQPLQVLRVIHTEHELTINWWINKYNLF